MKITKFERWMLKRIFRRIVVQGFDHAQNIQDVYKMIRDAAEEQFTEDNCPTMDAFLRELFENTQWKARP